MRITFAFKLGLSVTLLTLVVTGGALAYFYDYTKQIILNEMQERLSNIAHTGTYLLREEDRELIRLFKQQVVSDMGELNDADLDMAEEEAKTVFSPQLQQEYHNSIPFQYLVQLLRKVQAGSSDSVKALNELNQVISGPKKSDPQIQWVYLIAQPPQLRERGLVLFIVDTNYQDIDYNENGQLEDVEYGNPIGSLYRGEYEVFVKPFEDGQIKVSSDWYTDQWGTFMTAIVPIKDNDGSVIAALGLDYSVKAKANKLEQLFIICLGVFASAFALALVASFAMAGLVNVPISRLRRGAERFKNHQFTQPIKVNRNDEFGVLADTLNSMAVEINEYSENLEGIVAQRTKELATANEEILKLNASLKKDKESLGAELDIANGLQTLLLPEPGEFAHADELDIDLFMQPAAQIGGDYFDIINRDSRTVFSIGDVSGHGLETGVFMLMMRSAVHAVIKTSGKDFEYQYNLINQVAYGDVQRMQSDKHMTLSLLCYEGDGRFQVTGQHQDLLVVRDAENIETIDTSGLGLPIGLVEDISEFVDSVTVKLRIGQTLVMYTNGLLQAENEAGEPYGIERLLIQLKAHGQNSAAAMKEAIVKDWRAFLGGTDSIDDMSLMLIKRKR